MNFKLLKLLIFNIKQTVKCQFCNKRLSDKDISVKSTDKTGALIECNCQKCEKNFKIDAKLHKFKPQNTRSHKPINSIEINSMKEFLNDFNGDFKSIFKS